MAVDFSGIRKVVPPVNEPVRSYAPGSPERASVKARLASMAGARIEIPLVIGGRCVRTGQLAPVVMPHDHRHVLADVHQARPEDVTAAIAAAHGAPPQISANGAGAALEHHLGMTCDPVAGFVQVPCIERCAFGAVKAWTGYLIAQNEIPENRRVDVDSVITAMAMTAKDMNPKYKETSEAGLAQSLVLC